MYSKKGTFPSGIFLLNAKQKKPFVLLDNEIKETSHYLLVVRVDATIVLIKKRMVLVVLLC